jgi:hypothetical protein
MVEINNYALRRYFQGLILIGYDAVSFRLCEGLSLVVRRLTPMVLSRVILSLKGS